MGPLKQLALLAIFATSVYAERRDGKSIGIFNIVKFDNDVCDTGNQMNGTCYTAEECTNRNGVASGSCAEGYGVCCVITLTCGATTRENCTYLSQTATNTPDTDSDSSQSCTYNICPVTASVRRIRLEMEQFDIEGPFAPDLTGNAAGSFGTGNSIGQCLGDSFVAASGVGSSPVICGTNTGQHMVLDTDGSMCVTAIFNFRSGGNQQRSYRIHVLQFGEFNDMGGPMGCLQYYTGEMGTVNSFNWNGIATSVHLANQNYNVCVRRRVDACRICWSPIQTPTTIGSFANTVRGTFGIGNAGDVNNEATAGKDADCVAFHDAATRSTSGDFVEILGGNDAGANMGADLVDAEIAIGEGGFDFFCGRFLSAKAANSMEDRSVCSRATPFRLGVNFDGYEAVGTGAGTNAKEMAEFNEASGATVTNNVATTPLGFQGFSLGFAQLGC